MSKRPGFPPSPRPSFTAAEINRLDKLAQERLIDPSINEYVRRDRAVLYAYITIAANTGMRPTEMLNLNWGDVLGYRADKDKTTGTRDIRIRAHGKGKSREFIPHLGAMSGFDILWMLWKREHENAEPSDDDPVLAAPARETRASGSSPNCKCADASPILDQSSLSLLPDALPKSIASR